MKAVALILRKPDSLYLGELPSSSVDGGPRWRVISDLYRFATVLILCPFPGSKSGQHLCSTRDHPSELALMSSLACRSTAAHPN